MNWLVSLTEEGGRRELRVSAPGPLTAIGKALATWSEPLTEVIVVTARSGDCTVTIKGDI